MRPGKSMRSRFREFGVEFLEQRVVFDSVPVVDGFYHPGGPQAPNTWPRLPGTVTYTDGVPQLTITYEQMKAALKASDPDNDTVYFLYRGMSNIGIPNGNVVDHQITIDNTKMGLIDDQGKLIAWPLSPSANLVQYDTNLDGVPDGPLVLEPGETWTWRGIKNQPFTGRDVTPPQSGNLTSLIAPDSGLRIAVTDRVRPLSTMPSGFVSMTGTLMPALDLAALYAIPDSRPAPWDTPLGHGQTLTFTYDMLAATIPVLNPGGGTVYFALGTSESSLGVYSGELRVNGTLLNDLPKGSDGRVEIPHDPTVGSPFVLGPGDTLTYKRTGYQDYWFIFRPWTPGTPVDFTREAFFRATQAQGNTSPTRNAAPDLGVLSIARRAMYTGAELISLMNVADADNDPLSFAIEGAQGALLVNGQPWYTHRAITPTDTIEFIGSGFIPGRTGFTISVDDHYTSSSDRIYSNLTFSSAQFNTQGPLGDTSLAVGARPTSAEFAFGTMIVWRAPNGDLIVSVEERPQHPGNTPSFVRRNLTAEFGLDPLTADPVVGISSESAFAARIFAPTTPGLVALTFDRSNFVPGVWTLENYSVQLPNAPIRDLAVNGTLVLGHNKDGDMVVLVDGIERYQPVRAPVVVDVNQQLALTSQTMPAFVGDLIFYATGWGSVHVSGVDQSGTLWSVWTPTLQRTPDPSTSSDIAQNWGVSNLSQITGVGSLKGSLGVYLTYWGGINITGLDNSGHLMVTWWIPEFKGNWVTTDFTQLFGGPSLHDGSIFAYTTSWSALNISGIDSSGQAWVYWWEPSRAGTDHDVWSVEKLGPTGFDPTRHLDDSYSADGLAPLRLTMVGASSNNQIRALYWMNGFGSDWLVLSA